MALGLNTAGSPALGGRQLCRATPGSCSPHQSRGDFWGFPARSCWVWSKHSAHAWLSASLLLSIACCCLTFCSLYSGITRLCSGSSYPVGFPGSALMAVDVPA